MVEKENCQYRCCRQSRHQPKSAVEAPCGIDDRASNDRGEKARNCEKRIHDAKCGTCSIAHHIDVDRVERRVGTHAKSDSECDKDNRDRTGTALGVMDTFFAIAGFLAPDIT